MDMSPFAESFSDHEEIVSWVSKQHGQIPVTELEAMMGLPPLDEEEGESQSFEWE